MGFVRSRWAIVVTAMGVLFVGAQVVPYGRDHANPPVVLEPAWDSPATREVARRACFDCHSNETRWPAYASIAPGSWLIRYDVTEGREEVNFSEWQRPQDEAGEVAEVVLEREMPPLTYRLLHPEARLTDAERERLAEGLDATVGRRTNGHGDDGEDDEAATRHSSHSLIPPSVRAEHEAIQAALAGAVRAPGRVGVAARALDAVLGPHFAREEEIALPPLGLLAPLASGTRPPVPSEVLSMTDALRAELPGMLAEHTRIRTAVEALREAARADRAAQYEQLADQLALHARTEEEVLYPAAVLVGDLIRAREISR